MVVFATIIDEDEIFEIDASLLPLPLLLLPPPPCTTTTGLAAVGNVVDVKLFAAAGGAFLPLTADVDVDGGCGDPPVFALKEFNFSIKAEPLIFGIIRKLGIAVEGCGAPA